MAHTVDAFDHARHRVHVWLADVERALGTGDRRLAYRLLRAWLHGLRDQLTVAGAVAFAAQLPDLLRGVYYDGWQPHRAPVKYGEAEYVRRLAHEARIPVDEVRPAAAAIAKVLAERLSPGQVAEALAQLPAPLRAVVGGPAAESNPPAAEAPDVTAYEMLAELEARVEVLTAAVRTLASGLEQSPGASVEEQRRSRAAHLAAEMLLAVDRPPAEPARGRPHTATEAGGEARYEV